MCNVRCKHVTCSFHTSFFNKRCKSRLVCTTRVEFRTYHVLCLLTLCRGFVPFCASSPVEFNSPLALPLGFYGGRDCPMTVPHGSNLATDRSYYLGRTHRSPRGKRSAVLQPPSGNSGPQRGKRSSPPRRSVTFPAGFVTCSSRRFHSW